MEGVQSNLECLLAHTTPTVPCIHSSLKAAGGGWKTEKCRRVFNMGDLWRCYEEWSAYGAGVPLMLPCGDTIVQYYVPYLSALQIYTLQCRRGALFSKQRVTCDENEWNDTCDDTCESRGTSSNSSSDNEINEVSRKTNRDQWKMGNCASLDRLSCKESTRDEVQRGDHQGHLTFEYFEKSSPYGRAPLKEKINELEAQCPLLFSLHSSELSSASWFSVAWYPIYRIPMGPTMEDLSTCFLTFHSLWTPFTLQEGAPWECGKVLKLPAFGLASYKLKGPFWASAALDDKRKVFSLATCADAWLRQLRVQHPDFEFFISRHCEANQPLPME